MSSSDYRNWKKWDQENFGRYTLAEAMVFSEELKLAGFVDAPGATVLEIGFGNGHFMAWGQERGWNVFGTEIDPELVSRAQSAGMEAHAGENSIERVISGRKIDLVVCFDVLEHLTVDEIVTLLVGLRCALGANGRIIVRVPSGDSPFCGSVQHSDLTHKTLIGSGMVHQFADKAGLRVVQIREPAFPLRGLGLACAMRRFAVLCLRKVLSVLIRLAFHDGQSLVITRNMVVVWALNEPELR